MNKHPTNKHPTNKHPSQADKDEIPNEMPFARPTQVRHEVLILLTLAAAIAYLTRNAVGVGESTIREDLGLFPCGNPAGLWLHFSGATPPYRCQVDRWPIGLEPGLPWSLSPAVVLSPQSPSGLHQRFGCWSPLNS